MYRAFAWNVLFRLHERAKGHRTFEILRDMEAADRLSAPALARLQTERLREFMVYCYAHVPYIRERMVQAGLEPSQVRDPEDLARLPIMQKADIRKQRERLRSDLAGTLVSCATGGSTGEPLIFDIGKRRAAARVACRQRVARWWGVSVGDPEVALWGSPVELTAQDRIRGLRDRLLRTRLLPAFEMDAATISRYLDLIEKRPCRQIFGYPSAIYLLCLHAQKQSRDMRRLGIKVAFVTGEVLLPQQRALITEVLNCPVANGYGGRDSGFIAHECPQGGMHVLSDATVIEIVDSQGRRCPQGEVGEIVATDLYSHEAPFIRYATGDLGVWSVRRCACGRLLPLLERIEGRCNDLVLTPDGRLINSLALIYPVREIVGIEQFEIRQKTVTSFHIKVVRNAEYSGVGEERIQSGWAQLLHAPVRITFEYLPALPAQRSGKFRHFISEIPAGCSLTSGEHIHA